MKDDHRSYIGNFNFAVAKRKPEKNFRLDVRIRTLDLCDIGVS